MIGLWQNVWSKKPIQLEIIEDGKPRTITAQFDPNYDSTGQHKTDLGKVAWSHEGTAKDRRVTLDLGADLYRIIETSKYNDSEKESGKNTETHEGVRQWHYFTNDIYYRENGATEQIPYTAYIDIKEKEDGGIRTEHI